MGTARARMQQVLPFTSSARPSGTVRHDSISYTAKSTRKLAQRAPEAQVGGIGGGCGFPEMRDGRGARGWA